MGKIGRNERSILIGNDNKSNLRYVITVSLDGSWYYIYDKDYKKLGKGKDPTELELKYFGVK